MKNWWKNISREERNGLVKAAIVGTLIGLLIGTILFTICNAITESRRKEAEELNQLRWILRYEAEENFQENEIVAYIPCNDELLILNVDTKEVCSRYYYGYTIFAYTLQDLYGEADYYIYNVSTNSVITETTTTHTYEEIRSLALERLSEADSTQ